jgi:acetylornithine deacetylase/succinyl-diaminopimelate desuccinylase-like protein
MQDLTSVFSHIDDNRDVYLARLLDYVRMPSISAHGVGIGEVAAFLVEELNALGMQAKAIPTAGWPMVLGRRDDAPGRPTVMLYGHYDVQPPDPLDQWVTPPFEPSIREGRIYARGVGDNKGQHFAQLLAVEALMAVHGELPCNVVVLLEGEEEIGSPRIADFCRGHRDELEADLVIAADGPIHESGHPCIKFGVRGIVSFELRARTAVRDLHSGHWGNIAPNAIWKLVHLLGTMKNARGEITIEGIYDDVLPPTPAERTAMDALPLDVEGVKRELGLSQLDEPIERPFFERTMFWPTLTINGFHGGYGGPGSKTVLPSEALVKCDIRTVERMTAEDVFAKVEAHVKKHAPDVQLVRQGSMEPSRTPIESIFTEPIRRGLALGQGDEPLLIPSGGASLPAYVFTKILGIPAFGIPYANVDEANHAPNENLEIERFFKGIKSGAAMLAYLGAQGHLYGKPVVEEL